MVQIAISIQNSTVYKVIFKIHISFVIHCLLLFSDIKKIYLQQSIIVKVRMAGGRPRALEEIFSPQNIIPSNVMAGDMKITQLAVEAGLREDDPDQCIQWLATRGLLANSRICEVCPGNIRCRLIRRADAVNDKFNWRCPNCTYKKSIRHDSFFSGKNLSLQKIFELIYHWSKDHREVDVKHELDIGDDTIVEWYNFIRDVCGLWVTDHANQIGGIDHGGNSIQVQIDESKFMHRKYHRGLFREGHWVFGGIEVGVPQPNCFLVVCPGNRRDAATLLPLITQWIAPGSTVVSDMWAAYGGVANLPGGYRHVTVNHSLHFVDPVTGDHTNNVEGQWSHVKRKFRAMSGTSDRLFDSYLLEYMWRKSHKELVFYNMLYWIRHYYDV